MLYKCRKESKKSDFVIKIAKSFLPRWKRLYLVQGTRRVVIHFIVVASNHLRLLLRFRLPL